jgi:hypothetical protein
MKIFFSNLLCFFMVTIAVAQKDADIASYISQYAPLAVNEQIRTGIPAAIKLAQAIHESGAGKGDLALRSNNHFGIKCKSNWAGATAYHDDDETASCLCCCCSGSFSRSMWRGFKRFSRQLHSRNLCC